MLLCLVLLCSYPPVPLTPERRATGDERRILPNKPNLPNAQMNLNPFPTKDYNDQQCLTPGQTNPIKPNFKSKKYPCLDVPGGDRSAGPGLAWQRNYSKEQEYAKKLAGRCQWKIPFVTGSGRFGRGLLGFGGKEARFERKSRL